MTVTARAAVTTAPLAHGWMLVFVIAIAAGPVLAAETPAARTPQSITDRRADDPVMEIARHGLLRQAEAALSGGETALAADAFERAAMMLHAPDTEMGLIRTAMQQGQYRRALAFSAHTAGGHLESGAAGALYAWLLRVGGHDRVGDRVLAETLSRMPTDAVARAAQRALAEPWPSARGLLLTAPHRMAPEDRRAVGAAPVATNARVASSGVLIEGGRRALVPGTAATLLPGSRVWVRNGLGEATAAVVDETAPALAAAGLALVRLEAPLPFEAGDEAAGPDPFAGSPGFVVEYSAAAGADAAWPWLRQGFIGGGIAGAHGVRRLGIDVAPGPRGGLVMGAAGQVAGISISRADGTPSFVPASLWRPAAATTAVGAGRLIPADEAYERALRVTLQLLVDSSR